MKYQIISLIAATALMAACSTAALDGDKRWPVQHEVVTSSPSELDGLTAEGTDFTKALFAEYRALTGAEAAEGDHDAANRFKAKAIDAATGMVVQPEVASRWGIPSQLGMDFQAARDRLIIALNAVGRAEMPADAAKAQAKYDCWVEESEEGDQPGDIRSCREDFLDLVEKMEAALAPEPEPEPMAEPEPEPEPETVAATAAPQPAPPPRDYLVFFDFDDASVRPDAASILDRVMNAIQELASTSVTLVGHADRSGPDAYNQRLSESRATAVENYLGDRGVPSENVSPSGRGESDPRVPTPDGVREQENRRVEIRLD